MRAIEEIKADIESCKACTKYKTLCHGDCQICDCIHDSNLSNYEYEFFKAITLNTSLDRLEQICKAEGEGKIHIFPCDVGDTVYTNLSMQGWYMRKQDRPYPTKIVFIGVNGVDNYFNVVFEDDGKMLCFNFSDIGKTVFLTLKEAEKKLKEASHE